MSAPRANPPHGERFTYFNLPPGWSTDRSLYVEYDAPGGAGSLHVPDADVAPLVRDPVGYVLRRLGFDSYEQYRRWVDQDGAVRCCAVSRSGQRCKRLHGSYAYAIDEWLAAEAAGWRCKVHQGAPR